MGVVSDPPRGLRVEDLRKTELISSNPNSPFVKDGYRSEDMDHHEVNQHVSDLLSYAGNLASPGQGEDEDISDDEHFQASDGPGEYVANLNDAFNESTDNRRTASSPTTSSDNTSSIVDGQRLSKLTEMKAARDRQRRKAEEEEEPESFWSWCCASTRTTDMGGGSSTQEHKIIRVRTKN